MWLWDRWQVNFGAIMEAEEICETVEMHIMLYIISGVDGEH